MEKTILPPCPSLDADTEAKLRRYGALLLETNERVRLVGPRDETTLWNEHIADCLRLLPLLPPSGSVIDARRSQKENALSPMAVTPSGSVTDARLTQPSNARSPMILVPCGTAYASAGRPQG